MHEKYTNLPDGKVAEEQPQGTRVDEVSEETMRLHKEALRKELDDGDTGQPEDA